MLTICMLAFTVQPIVIDICTMDGCSLFFLTKHTHKLVNTGKQGPPIVPLVYTRNTSHMFCTRLANGGLFPTGDPIVPFVISPRFECLNKLTHTWGMLQ